MKHQDVIERANKRVRELVDALDVFPANYSAYHNKVESVLLDLNYWWGQELDRQREELLDNVNRVEVIDHTGRAYTFWEDKADVTMAIQDEGRTLKVFIEKSHD